MGKRKVCPRCRGGYAQGFAEDGRPRFVCMRCAFAWTCGHDGGEWALFAPQGPQANSPNPQTNRARRKITNE
jgi:hypothetical protein